MTARARARVARVRACARARRMPRLRRAAALPALLARLARPSHPRGSWRACCRRPSHDDPACAPPPPPATGRVGRRRRSEAGRWAPRAGAGGVTPGRPAPGGSSKAARPSTGDAAGSGGPHLQQQVQLVGGGRQRQEGVPRARHAAVQAARLHLFHGRELLLWVVLAGGCRGAGEWCGETARARAGPPGGAAPGGRPAAPARLPRPDPAPDAPALQERPRCPAHCFLHGGRRQRTQTTAPSATLLNALESTSAPMRRRTALVMVADTSTQRAGSGLDRTAARIAFTCGVGSQVEKRVGRRTEAAPPPGWPRPAAGRPKACVGRQDCRLRPRLRGEQQEANARMDSRTSGPKPRSNMVSASSSTTTSTSP